MTASSREGQEPCPSTSGAGVRAVDYTKLFEPAAFWGFLGLATGAICTLLNERRKAAREADAEQKKQSSIDRDAAFKELMSVVETLKGDVKDLRKRLDDERDMRKALHKELEQERALRLAAESEVRQLRDDLQAMRNELQRRGVKLPDVPAGD